MKSAMQFKARMRNLAAEHHIPAQAVLQNFMLERLLERISLSRYRDHIVLKGGMLIASMVGISSRTTMDMDATVRNFPLTEDSIRSAFVEICAIALEDEICFTLESVTPIRDDDEYGGYRVAINARFEIILTPMKIDVTAGDVITPGPICYSFPSAFEEYRIDVWAYNLETILAEKVETIFRRSVLNTRLRDFYDVYILTQTHGQAIDPAVFQNALTVTARHRGSLEGIRHFESILLSIMNDPTMRTRWSRYCKEYHYAEGISFDDVITAIKEFMPSEIK